MTGYSFFRMPNFLGKTDTCQFTLSVHRVLHSLRFVSGKRYIRGLGQAFALFTNVGYNYDSLLPGVVN